jgi:hypothetical protein
MRPALVIARSFPTNAAVISAISNSKDNFLV